MSRIKTLGFETLAPFVACHLLFIRSVESIFMCVLDHADLIYARAAASAPKPHDAIHHPAFILSLEMPIPDIGVVALPSQLKDLTSTCFYPFHSRPSLANFPTASLHELFSPQTLTSPVQVTGCN